MLEIKETISLKLKHIKDFLEAYRVFSFGKLLALILVIVNIGVLSILYLKNDKVDSVQNTPNYDMASFSREQRITKARKDYKKFRNTDKNVILLDWLKVCGNWQYKSGGSNQFNFGDCVGAVDANLEKWGSLLPREDIATRLKRLEKLRLQGNTYKITNTSELRTGDLIFIQLSWNNPSHVGMIYDSPCYGKLRYIDVNSDTKGWNLNTISIGELGNKIYAIYAMTVEVWIGDGGKDEK